MNSEAHLSPLVTELIRKVLFSLKDYSTVRNSANVINADLVPKVSDKLKKHLDLHPSIHHQKKVKKAIIKKKIINKNFPPVFVERKINLQKRTQKVLPVPSSRKVILEELYNGKLKGLINDPSVSSIECIGPKIPLNIFRYGQKMRTKIYLSKKEIKRLLEEISVKSKIPLSDGVFRVIVNNLLINAVISDIVGTKFLIKKLFQVHNIGRNSR